MFSRFFIAIFVLMLAPPARAQDDNDVLKDLQKRVRALEGAPAKASLGSFNPALGMALDGALSDVNGKAGFLLRAAEMNIEAPVDPHLKAWAIITGSNGGVDVEEATLETTSLPHNLTARGGRLFAAFGRLAHFHDHELPVIARPMSLDAYIGGETQADGLEVSYLLPTNLYLNATFGAYNKLGAENGRVKNADARGLHEFTYLGRLNAYLDLTDSQSVELGADAAWTPKRVVTGLTGATETRADTWRTLSGFDLTYRYQPPQGGLYKGLIWSTEIMRNDERRFDQALLPKARTRAYGGFTYVEVKSGRRLRGGAMADLTEDPDNARMITKTFTGFLTCDVTEFQRLRLAVAESKRNIPGSRTNNTVALQWTGVIGRHVHGFRDR